MKRAALLLILAGCASLPGPVAQLDGFTADQTAGRFDSIAKATVVSDCRATPFGSDACPRIHAIRARACLELARQEAAPGAACPPASASARQNLGCAVESYALAGNAALTGGDASNLTENRARARYCAARLQSPAKGLSLARAAGEDMKTLPPSASHDLLAASASLFVAQQATAAAADRCSAAQAASTLAQRGLSAGPTPPQRDALSGTRVAAAEETRSLPGCGVP